MFAIEKFDHTLKTLPKETLVEFEIYRDYRDTREHYIGVYKGYDEKHDLLEFGHPYDMEKNTCPCGVVGCRMQDIVYVRGVPNKEIVSTWLKAYNKFTNSVWECCGYDYLSEDFDKIRVYFGPKVSK